MTVDVVYKLGNPTKHGDAELKYSLRSLSNFKDLGKVYIVGMKPSWIQNIIYIPMTDPHPANKDHNLINKIIVACCEKEITEEFLNFSDDQVLLKECSYYDFDTPHYDNSLIQFTADQKLNRWKTRLRNTIFTLQEKGLPADCYEAHIPTLINKHDYAKTVMQYLYSLGQGMCGNTLYFNTLKKKGFPLPESYATKLESAVESYEVLKSLCEGRLHLNYSEAATNDNLLRFLEEKFPNKSKYEL